MSAHDEPDFHYDQRARVTPPMTAEARAAALLHADAVHAFLVDAGSAAEGTVAKALNLRVTVVRVVLEHLTESGRAERAAEGYAPAGFTHDPALVRADLTPALLGELRRERHTALSLSAALGAPRAEVHATLEDLRAQRLVQSVRVGYLRVYRFEAVTVRQGAPVARPAPLVLRDLTPGKRLEARVPVVRSEPPTPRVKVAPRAQGTSRAKPAPRRAGPARPERPAGYLLLKEAAEQLGVTARQLRAWLVREGLRDHCVCLPKATLLPPSLTDLYRQQAAVKASLIPAGYVSPLEAAARSGYSQDRLAELAQAALIKAVFVEQRWSYAPADLDRLRGQGNAPAGFVSSSDLAAERGTTRATVTQWMQRNGHQGVRARHGAQTALFFPPEAAQAYRSVRAA
ncbi:hypothetical protein [Deinococcus soli (ex Cha et al. 2016)]|uniref:Uncharacterized protein n=2 Tax=Deinococcus soli (ex Cha et al. 2016) TaxID=1309411 RepID=A0ACC6KFS4_9DEIO|nr:hypothetical protein [Deinococcus soli (ex Cha et al. 2016)]MDR6218387.1 hypothetical protein [Deinococcus soli (ex Cha et al. 2016)]MDR6329127.1 hypothetical protein [Deinococcus soli (ex Cha et al. 2016)]MDR6751400.1 hypothetical protein [Deinococcus soli (ex Cha et al. 2016)]